MRVRVIKCIYYKDAEDRSVRSNDEWQGTISSSSYNRKLVITGETNDHLLARVIAAHGGLIQK
jgi:hypothetical protein